MKVKMTICAAVFVLLTGIKLAFPTAAAQVRSAILPQISQGNDLSETVSAIGKRLSGGTDELIYASELERSGDSLPVDTKNCTVDVSADFVLDEMVESNISGFTEGSNSLSPTEEQLDKREAFLSVQAAYSGVAIPSDVSYEIPCLSFAHVNPANAAVSSSFGYRVHPVYGDVRFHYGTDYALNEGDEIHAFSDGTVICAQRYNGYGLTVILDHGDDWTTLYAHCSQILVNVGDTVKAGDSIALAGHSGAATGPHLHFEIECAGVRYNPELCF